MRIFREETTTMATRAATGPRALQIWRACAEWAEAEWLAARSGGMADPVLELWALDEADPGRVIVAVADRVRLARKLAACCPPVVTYLRAAPPGLPFSVVILTPLGVDIDHRSAPDALTAVPSRPTTRKQET